MLSTARGSLPNSSIAASNSGSADRLPVPPTRSVSSMPGTKKISCTKPLPSTILRKLSIRLLPLRSGISSRFGPATLTKPGLPPRGEASTLPSEPEVASTQNGDIAMNFFACASIPGRAFGASLAVGGLVFDCLGATGYALLGGSTFGRRQGGSVGREGFRENAIHGIGPAAIMLNDLVGDMGHAGTRLRGPLGTGTTRHPFYDKNRPAM